MNKQNCKEEICAVALAMFRKNFLGIFHGSISAKTEHDRIIINTKNAIFDRLDDEYLMELCSKKDYRWTNASIDAHIHFSIYKNISEAKFVCYTMPPFITAYTLEHNIIAPKDYFAYERFGKIEVYDPGNFDDWYERADVEISRYLKENDTNIMVIKGYGVYCFDRDIYELSKSIAILENCCRLLNYSK